MSEPLPREATRRNAVDAVAGDVLRMRVYGGLVMIDPNDSLLNLILPKLLIRR